MPRIIVNEYDNTTAANADYANFSVLIFGPTAEGKEIKNVVDENNVYECSSVTDFEMAIGKVPSGELKVTLDAVAPTLYDPSAEINGGSSPVGTPVKCTGDNIEAIKKKVTDGEFSVYLAEESEEAQPGFLSMDGYVFKKVSTVAEVIEDSSYAIILPGGEGQDGNDVYSYGNQMAYELLKLGYTVLYRVIDQDFMDSLKKAGTERDEEINKVIEPLKDKSVYDFRYVVTGFMNETYFANALALQLCEAVNETSVSEVASNGRGDCILLVDIPYSWYTAQDDSNIPSPLTQVDAVENIKNNLASGIIESKYVAIFAPYVKYNFTNNEVSGYISEGENDGLLDGKTFPASFHYLACAAKSNSVYNEWYAVAGYTRGISDYDVAGLGCTFGENAANVLQPRQITSDGVHCAVNLIIKIRNEYLIWGNRTAYALNSSNLLASHFLNIRQLCTTIKKEVYYACKRFTFDPSSDLLWNNFTMTIRPTLEKMKADQGITDYKIVRVQSKERAVLKARIRVVPVEACEDFYIDLVLEDSIAGTTVNVDESENA